MNIIPKILALWLALAVAAVAQKVEVINSTTGAKTAATVGGALALAANGTATLDLTSSSNITGPLAVTKGGTGLTVFPKFAATKGGTNQTAVPTGTFTKVTFSTERFDVNNNFASSTWTPTAGSYVKVTAAVDFLFVANGTALILAVYKNGSIYSRIDTWQNGSGSTVNFTAHGSVIVPINGSSDTIELYAWQNSGGNMDLDGDATTTYFEGAVIP